jgi:hypothetical protein
LTQSTKALPMYWPRKLFGSASPVRDYSDVRRLGNVLVRDRPKRVGNVV